MSNPVGSFAVYGKSSTGANVAIAETGATYATGTLTFSGQPANGETFTINGRVYTFVTALTGNVNGQTTGNQILIGANAEASIVNAAAAINKTPGSDGTLYSYGTSQNTSVTASAASATTLVLTAIQIGADGNSITTTETIANASWGGAATLTGGVSGALLVSGAGGGSSPAGAPVTVTSVAVGASTSGTIPAGAKGWTFTVLTGTATFNGVASLPAGFSESDTNTLAAAISYNTASASTAYVRYNT